MCWVELPSEGLFFAEERYKATTTEHALRHVIRIRHSETLLSTALTHVSNTRNSPLPPTPVAGTWLIEGNFQLTAS